MTDYKAKRLDRLPTYLFAHITKRKQEAIAAGRDIIDFGVGDPDTPAPDFIVNRMAEAIRNPDNHKYAFGVGSMAFRETVATFMKKRYGVSLDPVTEVVALLGAKDAVAHLPLGVVDPGDVVLAPTPGYPGYVSGTVMAGADYHAMPLREDNDWLPDLSEIPEDICRRAKLMWLNYPNNPTGAMAPRSFFEDVVAFAKKWDILVVEDAPYCEVYYGEAPLSILQIDGAREVCIELHSMSKTFNMTGWRIGFAVGNADALSLLAKVKANLDSGVFPAIQEAGMAALEGYDRPEMKALTELYRTRRDIMAGGLREAGWPVTPPEATFYLWAKCPPGVDSWTVSNRALDEANIVVTPGAGLGPSGEGFVRFSLTVNEARTREAVQRLSNLSW